MSREKDLQEQWLKDNAAKKIPSAAKSKAFKKHLKKKKKPQGKKYNTSAKLQDWDKALNCTTKHNINEKERQKRAKQNKKHLEWLRFQEGVKKGLIDPKAIYK